MSGPSRRAQAAPGHSPLARVGALAAAVWLGTMAARAAADAVSEDYERPRCRPVVCPVGTHPFGQIGHHACGEGCRLPNECGEPERCHRGSECRETRYCVVRRFAQGPVIADTVFGECAADGSCERGECVVSRRCVSPRAPVVPSTGSHRPARTGGFGRATCAATSSGRDARRSGLGMGGWLAVAALGAGVASRARRRVRPSRSSTRASVPGRLPPVG
jgi:hypothetical protein